MDQLSFRKAASTYVDLPPERWQSIENVAALEIKKIECAVIVVLALWSGPAVVILRSYSQAMRALYPRDVPLIVVDIDSVQKPVEGFPSPLMHGIGETFFVKGGTIVESIVTLLRMNKKTVVKIPGEIDIPASVQRFSDFYEKVFG